MRFGDASSFRQCLFALAVLLVPALGEASPQKSNVFFSGFPAGSTVACDGLEIGIIQTDGAGPSVFLPDGNPTFRIVKDGKVLLERSFKLSSGKKLYVVAPNASPNAAAALAPPAKRELAPKVLSPVGTVPGRSPQALISAATTPPPKPASSRTASTAPTARPAPIPVQRRESPVRAVEEISDSSLLMAFLLSGGIIGCVVYLGWRRYARLQAAAPPASPTLDVEDLGPTSVQTSEPPPPPTPTPDLVQPAAEPEAPFGSLPQERPEFLEELRLRENQVALGIIRRTPREEKPFILDLTDFRIRDDS